MTKDKQQGGSWKKRIRKGLRSSVRRFKDISGWDSQFSARPLASALAEAPVPLVPLLDSPPSMDEPVSQMPTAAQIHSETYRAWCEAMQMEPRLDRKQWEYCFIAQVLESRGYLREGRRALGFGVGQEPLPSLLAARGLEVVATDLPSEEADARGWSATNQFAGELEKLNARGLCDPELFRQRASYRTVDMTDLPDDLGTFDVVWSSCAFEHLGDLEKGLDFVMESVELLRPGGIAVHTTEYNLSSNDATVVAGPSVYYRRQDMEMLARIFLAGGDRMALNFHPGLDDEDRHVDRPPYDHYRHLRVQVDEFVVTSFGVIVERNPFRGEAPEGA